MNSLVIDYESEDLVGGWDRERPELKKLRVFQSTGKKLSELYFYY